MKTRAHLLALALLATALGGCRDNRASVSVHGICAVEQSCTFGGKCSAFLAGNPGIDAVTSGDGRLTLFFEVGNQLADNTQKDTFKTNTNDAHVDTVMIDYEGVALPHQVVATNQLVQVGGTAVIGVDVIPPSAANAAALAAFAPGVTPRMMTAVLKFGGYWDDGSRWETGEFPVGVNVCSNCIAACGTGVACPPGNLGQVPSVCN